MTVFLAACVSPQEDPLAAQDPDHDGVLLPSTWFNDTVVFLDLHNHRFKGEEDVKVRVTFLDDSDPPIPWYLMGQLYDEEGVRGQAEGFGLIGAGAHREAVVVRAEGEEFAAGPHDRPIYKEIGEVIEPIAGGLSTRAEADWVFDVPPGTHHLKIVMKGVEGELEVTSLNDPDGSLEPGNLTVDPDMFIEQRTLHDEWDHVETEVRIGSQLDWLIDAQSAAEIKYPYNSIWVSGTGAYKELEIKYPDGNTCNYSGSWVSSPPGYASADNVPLGDLTVSGRSILTDNHILNGLRFYVEQLPLELYSEPECFNDYFQDPSSTTGRCGDQVWDMIRRGGANDDFSGVLRC